VSEQCCATILFKNLKEVNLFICNILNFYVSHGNTTRFLRSGKMLYTFSHFVDNLFLFPGVKKNSKAVKIGEVIAKSSTPSCVTHFSSGVCHYQIFSVNKCHFHVETLLFDIVDPLLPWHSLRSTSGNVSMKKNV